MKKFKLIVISLVLSVVVALMFVACSKKTENVLTFEVQENLTTEVGNYFNVPTCIGEDTKGDIYSPTVTAVAPNGDEAIIEDGKIFIDYLGEYKITYTILFEEEYITKTTTVTSLDTSAPNIKLASEKDYVIVGSEYTLPIPEYEDNYDNFSDIVTSVAVKYGDNEVTVTNGKFTLSQQGEYKVTYTATDTSANKNEKVLTVTSFVGEQDNITYFNREFGTNGLGLREDVGTLSSTQETTLPGEEYSLKLSVGVTSSKPDNTRGVAGIFINNPYVKDVSNYEYLYFYVYTDTEGVGVTFNGIYSNHRIKANSWNKIVLTKYVDGDKIDYTTQWGSKVFYDAYRAEIGLDPWVGQPTDITGLMLYLYVPDDQTSNIYFSTIKGANSLPETTIDFNSVYALEEIDLPIASVEGYDNVTQKVFVTYDGETSEITSSTYTFENAGSYSFNYQVFSNGSLIDVVEKSVLVVEEEKGNLNYFNYSFGADNVSHNGMTGVSTSSSEKTIPGEQYSLKHVNNSYWGSSQILLNKAYQKNITEYKYLYFYIYVNKSDIGVTFNNIYSPDKSLIPSVWNRIVLTRNADGSNYVTPWGTNVFAETGASPINMDGFIIDIYHPANVDTTIYLSAMRGTNVDPEYATLDFNLNVTKGEAFDIPDATVIGASNVTQKVYHVTKGSATEITSDTYTLNENGTHTLAFEVYVDGKLLESVKKTVNIFDKEEGNVTYFNQSFGVNSVTSTNAVNVGISLDKKIAGENSSLECYLQAPGYWPTITIGNPFLKDLNAKDSSQEYLYDYVYFFAYSTGENTVLNVHLALGVSLKKNQWTRITLQRNGDTFYYNQNAVFGTDGVSANDITGLQICFDTTQEANYTSVYLSSIWAVKELPTFELEVNELNFAGAEINVAPTVTQGYTVQAYYNGQAYDTTNAFIPQEEGVYTFTYEISKDGKLVDIVTKDIVVTEVEEDNLSYFNREFATKNVAVWSSDTVVSANQEKVFGNEEYSLKVSAPAPYWGVGGVYINSYIEDISSYNYVYFYVYTDVVGSKFYNPTNSSVGGELNVGVWNKIVLVRQSDGSFTSGAGLSITSAQASNMNNGESNTHFGICLYATGGPNPGTFNGIEFYVSAIRVANELPMPESNVVLNLSSLSGENGLGEPNAMAFGPTSLYRHQGDECSTELYCQAVGWPTVKVATPLIANLNAKDQNEEYLYDYVYFYVKGLHQNTGLMIGDANVGAISNEVWTKVVLERNGDTFYIGVNNVFGASQITANDISGLQILVDTTGVGAWTSIYMSSWIACKTLPEA